MRKPILAHKWKYLIKKAEGYGYLLLVYKDGKIFHSQEGIFDEQACKYEAERIMLQEEFSIDPLYLD